MVMMLNLDIIAAYLDRSVPNSFIGSKCWRLTSTVSHLSFELGKLSRCLFLDGRKVNIVVAITVTETGARYLGFPIDFDSYSYNSVMHYPATL